MPNIYANCSECKREFYMTEKEMEYYTSMEFAFPRRCWNCRKKKQLERKNQELQQKLDELTKK